MRVTIDRDVNTFDDMLTVLSRGFIIIGRLPDFIKKSSGGRGYHYVWHNAAKDWDDCIAKRKEIGDDPNRIAHDMKKRKGFKQVLFTKKKVILYGFKNRIRKEISELQNNSDC